VEDRTVLESLGSSQISALIRSELWGWPLALTLHALGTALVLGLIFIISLRLLGLFELIPIRSLNRLFPIIWGALALQLVSGFVLWIAKPAQYTADGAFLLKVLLIVAGVVMTLNLSKMVARDGASWETGAVPARGLGFVATTLLVWCVVLVAGRLTGYLGSI
jgi:hypothetical protein